MKKLFSALLLLGSLMAFSSIPVVTLKTRDHKVEVKTTETGTLYTVFDKTGKELAKDKTLEQLQAQDETLADIIKNAIALNKDLHAGTHKVETRDPKLKHAQQ